MSPRHTHRLLLIALVIAWLEALYPAPASQPRKAPPKGPLPQGVQARLGNMPAALGDAVEAIAFSPHGRCLASAHHDHTLCLWELATGKKLGQFRGPNRPVAWLVFSPDGRSLLIGTAEDAGLWDASSGKLLSRLYAAEQRVVLVAMGPDGRARAWTEDARHTLHSWDVSTKRELCSSAGHTDRIQSVALSPDGAVLASSSRDGAVRLWDAASGKLLRQLKTRFHDDLRSASRDPQPVIRRLQFAPNGWMLLGSGSGSSYYLWETSTGGLADGYEDRRMPGEKKEIKPSRRRAQVFTPDSQVLLWFQEGQEGVLSWHDVATFTEIGGMGTEGQKVVTALAFAPDGSCLATGGAEGTILLWERRSLPWNVGRRRWRLNEQQLDDFRKDLGSAEGRRVYSASWRLALAGDQTIAFLRRHLRPAVRTSSDDVRRLLAALDDRDTAKRDRAFTRLIEAGESAEKKLRKSLQGQLSAEVRQRVGRILAEGAHSRLLRSLQILEQINTLQARQLLKDLASGASDAWMTRQAEAICKRLAKRPVTDVAADEPQPEPRSPLPKFILTEGPPAVPLQPGRDRYGDPLPKGATARIGTLRLRHQGEARAVAFSPDGKVLATGGSDNAVRLWDAATGEQQQCLRGHQGGILAIAFSSDGRLLASAGKAGEIVLWDVRTGREVERLGQRGVEYVYLAFGSDNRFLAAASIAEVILWDLTTSSPRQHWRGGRMDSRPLVALTPDGKALLCTQEGQIHIKDSITGNELRQFKSPSPDLLALKPMKDGRVLAAAFNREKGEITVWDSSKGRDIRRFDRLYNAGCVTFSPDGRSLAVGGNQFSWICLCDLAAGRMRWLRADSQQYGIHALAFSSDGKWLASADASGIVRLWDVAQGEERLLRGRPHGGLRCRLSGDGRTLATIEYGYHLRPRTLCLWETASGRLIRRLTTEEAEFTAIALSPDGKVLAAGIEVSSSENMVLLWDAISGKLRCRCRSPQQEKIVFLAFAPNGEHLAGGQDGRIHLWSVRTGEELRCFAGVDASMRAGAFSADSKSLVTASEDGSLRIWDTALGRETRRLTGHGGYPVGDVAFSPDGRLLASVGGDDFVSLWDAHDYRRLHRLPLRGNWLSCVALSPDGRLVASGDGDDGFTVWDTSTGQARCRAVGHAAAVISLAFCRDGKTVVSGSRDGTVLCWNLASLAPAGRTVRPATEKTDRYGDPLPPAALARLGSVRFRHESQVISVAFSPDGKTMATGSQGNSGTSVRLWDLATGRQLRLFRDYSSWISQVAFSPDGKLLAGASGGDVTFWDSSTGERSYRIRANRDGISRFAFSPNGKVVATADQPYNDLNKSYLIRLWDVAGGREIARFDGHQAEVTDLIFSADGKRLASCSGRFEKEQSILVWDLETGKLYRRFRVKGTWGLFSPDGRRIAVQRNKTIHLWDVDTEKPVSQVRTSRDNAVCLFVPDGGALAVGGEKGVQLHRVATGERLRMMANTTGRAAPFAFSHPAGFSPDGKLLATFDGSAVRLWDTNTGQEVRPFGGHRGEVTGLAFAPSIVERRRTRQVIASGGADRTVRLWEATTGREILCFEKHEKPIGNISFSPDGRTIASADQGGTVWLWTTASGEGLRRLNDLPGEATSLCFTENGRRLMACTVGGAVCAWDTATGKLLHRLAGSREAMRWRRPTALAPDGRLLVTTRTGVLPGNGNCALEYRSPIPGAVLRAIRCPEEHYGFLTFTGDGRFLAAMGYRIDHFHGHVHDAGVRLWEMARGQEVLRFEDVSTPFVFSPDGSVIACPWTDSGGTLWGIQCRDAATGRRLGRVAGHLDGVTDLAFSSDGRLVATGGSDGTVLVWDALPLTQHRPPPCPSAPRSLDDLWADLSSADEARAYNALLNLVRRPEDVVPFLRDRLRPVPPQDAERIARWIIDLDSAEFEDRRQAAAELEKLGELAEPAMRKALADRPSLEVRRRLEQLLERLDRAVYSAEQLRVLRAIAVLERIGNQPARRVLHGLAQGAAAARLTQEARASLARLARRTPSP